MPISVLGAAAVAAAIGAQSPLTPPLDTASLGGGPYARMSMLWEKTIFKVDVLTVEVRVDSATAQAIEAVARGRSDSKAVADSIAAIAVGARDAFVRIEFQRNVSLGQFLDGVRDNLRRVRDAGLIGPAHYDTIAGGLPRWFGFLAERGIHDGDRILYRIRGDTLRTLYVGDDREVALDQIDVGPERRLAVLGSYFVRGSDFREGLVQSILALPD